MYWIFLVISLAIPVTAFFLAYEERKKFKDVAHLARLAKETDKNFIKWVLIGIITTFVSILPFVNFFSALVVIGAFLYLGFLYACKRALGKTHEQTMLDLF